MRMSLPELKNDAWNESITERIRDTDVLIIDEISMVETHHLDRMNEAIKNVRCWSHELHGTRPDAPAFGGVQIIANYLPSNPSAIIWTFDSMRGASMGTICLVERGGVMLQFNLNISSGLVNGSQGIVVGWEPFDAEKLPRAKKNKSGDYDSDTLAGDHAKVRETEIRDFAINQRIREWPIVRFQNGTERTIYPTCVVNSLGAKEPYSLLMRTKVPLALVWAVSVHKSQGMTLNRVRTQHGRAWEQAQKYVALSRVTTMEGLQIDGGTVWTELA
ncbi:ATP-dependent DNA helicase PIF1 [Fusarium beomiforme]|uniref:ATP-dependent DNA helicase PIF1 n=1 Tax=Fusarium beomiforme TaxID=44412 RepID=A0A9P5A776_9HYPO|nr:ATP-dependent DNA helicase PIF1 [Fusarium beomiforme]